MNIQKNKKAILIPGFICFTLIIGFTACKKNVEEVLPGNKPGTALNFYSASDVMDAAYSPIQSAVAIYIDKYQEQSRPLIAGSGNNFPNIGFGFIGSHEYPSSDNGGLGINYDRYVAGDHHLFFTDANNTVVLDTTIKTKADGFYSLYFTDLPGIAGAAASYRLILTEEDRKVPEGKTGVRFVHLSADAGNITCNLQKANGDLTTTNAGELAFGEVSDYQFFSSEDIASGGLLRFTLSNAANEIKFDTGVPFNPGRSYVVVISGFRTDQQRQVATGKSPDGSIKKETINIGNNLRTEIRRSY